MSLWPITRRTFAGMAVLGAGAVCSRRMPLANCAQVTAAAPTMASVGPFPQAGVTVAKPEDFGAVADLHGDSGTDNTSAFRRIGAWLDATGGRVMVGGRYRITAGFAVHRGTMEFTGNGLIRNTTKDDDNYWSNTCVFFGTYFGYSPNNKGINTEIGYDIKDLPAGGVRVVFVNARDAINFPVGTLFYTTDANFYTNSGKISSPFPKASHASVVVSNIGDGAILLRDPAPFAITSRGAISPQARTDKGGFALSNLGIPAITPRIAKNLMVVNGAFESANYNNGQVIHIACHNSWLDFRWISGKDCVGANPVTDSFIQIRGSNYANTMFELAYHHHRVRVPLLRGNRIGSFPSSTVTIVAISEYGNSVTINEIDISDLHAQGDYVFRTAVSLNTPLTTLYSVTIKGAQFCGLAIGSNGQRADQTRIGRIKLIDCGGSKMAPSGLVSIVQIDANEVEIDAIEIDNTQYTTCVVKILPNAGELVKIGYTTLATESSAPLRYRIIDNRSVVKRSPIHLR